MNNLTTHDTDGRLWTRFDNGFTQGWSHDVEGGYVAIYTQVDVDQSTTAYVFHEDATDTLVWPVPSASHASRHAVWLVEQCRERFA